MEPNYYEVYLQCIEEAKKSECLRRKYGSAIISEDSFNVDNPKIDIQYGHNARVTRCCNSSCARDRFAFLNGERVEIGAEVHSEAGLLATRRRTARDIAFVLAGLNSKGQEMYAPSSFPCYDCARLILYAGFHFVWCAIEEGVIEPVSLYDIIEHREAEWNATVD